MQTKSEIQEILAIHGLRPNRRLGQNFLIDLNLMRLFIDKADVSSDDIVIEVGPGTGSMSESLAEKAGFFIAVEYDRGLAGVVRERIGDRENVCVIEGDVLKNQNSLNAQLVETVANVKSKFSGKSKLVANLPYDVSSALIINLLIGSVKVDEMCVTVQREIAEKMAAKPGDDLYGTLSVFMGAYGRAEIFHKLGNKVFWPQPKVDSAMINFVRGHRNVIDDDVFRQVVGMFFQHRRKTIGACRKFAPEKLKGVDWQRLFNDLKIDRLLRAGDLSPDDYVRIANYCSNYCKKI